ncbi:MAG: phosphodiester glycosidase family protein [Myxococcales bacterium]|nr:phosphodiester glycosidase family protein [Myxococcales bacterium]MCB9580817.1 phosphodiester glycosidase family protein [Polyangiaceae bacterium]
MKLRSFAIASCLTLPAVAAPGTGTESDPIVVDALPYALLSTTAGAPSSVIDGYDCAASTDESGPERIFRFSLLVPSRVTAWIEESGTVDVDVHLLDHFILNGGGASTCVSRGNTVAEAEMSAGVHYLVVDTFNGVDQAGEFVLHLDAIGDAWQDREIAQGVTWRTRRAADEQGGPQVLNLLQLDLGAPGLSLQAHPAVGCQTVPEIGEALGAQAGVNGGYFNVSTCAPRSLLKHAGQLVHADNSSRGAFGLSQSGAPLFSIVASGADWPEAQEAHGGGPLLVKSSVVTTDSDWATEGFTDPSFNGVNPRTWAGVDDQARVLLGTVDGRRDNADGMSLGSLGSYAASLGAVDAVNLDGGGSSQMWIAGATPNGVVNYPSDNLLAEEPKHSGARQCSGGWFVFANALNHAPRFQTTPVAAASVGSPWSYDADAIDLDVHDVLSFSLTDSPAGMSVDAVTGEVSFTPDAATPQTVNVVLTVSDDQGASTDQSFVLSVAGGTEPPDGGVGGQSGADSGPSATPPAPADDGGCGCRAPKVPPRSGLAMALLALLGAALRRRVRA